MLGAKKLFFIDVGLEKCILPSIFNLWKESFILISILSKEKELSSILTKKGELLKEKSLKE